MTRTVWLSGAAGVVASSLYDLVIYDLVIHVLSFSLSGSQSFSLNMSIQPMSR
jgi:hypothetical protein